MALQILDLAGSRFVVSPRGRTVRAAMHRRGVGAHKRDEARLVAPSIVESNRVPAHSILLTNNRYGLTSAVQTGDIVFLRREEEDDL